jgi:hypothetical protein
LLSSVKQCSAVLTNGGDSDRNLAAAAAGRRAGPGLFIFICTIGCLVGAVAVGDSALYYVLCDKPRRTADKR